MTDNENLAQAGKGIASFIHDMPSWAKGFFGGLVAFIALLPMLSATGWDERFFPRKNAAVEILIERMDALDAAQEKRSTETQERISEVSTKLAVIEDRAARRDADMQSMRSDIDDLQERMGRVEVRMGYLPRRKPGGDPE